MHKKKGILGPSRSSMGFQCQSLMLGKNGKIPIIKYVSKTVNCFEREILIWIDTAMWLRTNYQFWIEIFSFSFKAIYRYILFISNSNHHKAHLHSDAICTCRNKKLLNRSSRISVTTTPSDSRCLRTRIVLNFKQITLPNTRVVERGWEWYEIEFLLFQFTF